MPGVSATWCEPSRRLGACASGQGVRVVVIVIEWITNYYNRFLYTLMLAIDANFKLKMKDRGARNTYMGDGWAFFVSQPAYAEHLKNNTDITEVCRLYS